MNDADAEKARAGLVTEKGFFILPSELFCNVCAKTDNDENLNKTLKHVFEHFEEFDLFNESESEILVANKNFLQVSNFLD